MDSGCHRFLPWNALFASSDRRSGMTLQTGNVARDRLNLHITHTKRGGAHDFGVATVGSSSRILITLAEHLELRGNIFSVLTAQSRVSGRAVAITGRTMTTGASGHLPVCDPRQIDFTPYLNHVGVGAAARARLRIVKGSNIGEVIIRHVIDLARHKRHGPTPVTNIQHLLQQVLVTEASKLGEGGHGAIAIYTVTSNAGCRFGLPRLSITRCSNNPRTGHKRHHSQCCES